MFRILSLDGGGIKGTFSAAVLAQLEKDTCRRCVEHFDLIVGTSTGGIIALGLGLGISAAEIVAFYRDQGPTIFPSTSLVDRFGWIKQIFRPKRSHRDLRQALENVFKDRRFGESKCRLVIPTYDAVKGRVYCLKTAHHERFKYDHKAKAVDVALATSAAPTFFSQSPFPEFLGSSFVDGGVWANCPALVGVVEAQAFLGIPLNEIDLLSIGTTTTPFSIAERANAGIAQWNAGLVDLMFNGQIEAALVQAKLLVDRRLHRIDVATKAGEFSLDDARPEKINQLIFQGESEAKKVEHLSVVKSRFLTDPKAPPFCPIHG